MAESVQYYLERMIPELEGLEKKNIFSPVSVDQMLWFRFLNLYSRSRLNPSLKRELILNMLYNVVSSKRLIF